MGHPRRARRRDAAPRPTPRYCRSGEQTRIQTRDTLPRPPTENNRHGETSRDTSGGNAAPAGSEKASPGHPARYQAAPQHRRADNGGFALQASQQLHAPREIHPATIIRVGQAEIPQFVSLVKIRGCGRQQFLAATAHYALQAPWRAILRMAEIFQERVLSGGIDNSRHKTSARRFRGLRLETPGWNASSLPARLSE